MREGGEDIPKKSKTRAFKGNGIASAKALRSKHIWGEGFQHC